MTQEKTKKELFNEAMDLIDDMILSSNVSIEEKRIGIILKTVCDKYEYCLNIKELFSTITDDDMSLREYIKQRRNYFAYYHVQSCAYITDPEGLAGIADKFGYVDQPEMNKEFKKQFGMSPKTVSIKNEITKCIPDNKITWEKLFEGNTKRTKTTMDKAFETLNNVGSSQKALIHYADMLDAIKYYIEEYGFSEEEADLIATLSEVSGISMHVLFEELHTVWIEYNTEKAMVDNHNGNLFDKYMLTTEEIKLIKEKFDYEEYEIDDYAFMAYKLNLTPGQVYSISEKENCSPFDINKKILSKYRQKGDKNNG